ncbi:MAG: phosphate signaling complex protein PhoU [bacterium]|nr:phosphate signaling complex protein PhoU [bacterium]
MLEEKIDILKKMLVEYAGLIESMTDKSIKGLLKKEKELLIEVIEKDEPKVNKLEMEIDELCTNVIAQYEPKAKDLRTVLMILSMNTDMERMGDHAVNIAESGIFLIERPQLKPLIDIPRMAEITIKMLNDSINSFINQNSMLAKNVCERDTTVDDIRTQILRELVTYMSSDSSAIERALHLIRISGNLERLADLCTNICEDIIFMEEGRVIKHHAEEMAKEEPKTSA